MEMVPYLLFTLFFFLVVVMALAARFNSEFFRLGCAFSEWSGVAKSILVSSIVCSYYIYNFLNQIKINYTISIR